MATNVAVLTLLCYVVLLAGGSQQVMDYSCLREPPSDCVHSWCFCNVSASAVEGISLQLGRSPLFPLARANMGDVRSWGRVCRKAMEGQISALALGGSITRGTEAGGVESSWFAHLQTSLEAATGQKHNFVNLAVSGTTSNIAGQNLERYLEGYENIDWDVIFVDFGVNDVAHPHDHPDVVNNNNHQIGESLELLLRRIRTHFAKAAIISLELFRPRSLHDGFLNAQVGHSDILHYYQIPTVSVRDAVWHAYEEALVSGRKTHLTMAFPQRGDPAPGTGFLNGGRGFGGAHPSRLGQRLIADVVMEQWLIETDRSKHWYNDFGMLAQEGQLPPPLFNIRADTVPVVQYYFDEAPLDPKIPFKKMTNWAHVDQKTPGGVHKWGLLGQGNLGNELSVSLSGCTSAVYVTFLHSYESFGNANVTVSSGTESGSFLLESYWDRDGGSQAYSQYMDLAIFLPKSYAVRDRQKNRKGTKIIDVTFTAMATEHGNMFKLLQMGCN